MQKTHFVTFRANAQQVQKLEQLAAAVGCNRSALLQSIIDSVDLRLVARLEPHVEPSKLQAKAKGSAPVFQAGAALQ